MRGGDVRVGVRVRVRVGTRVKVRVRAIYRVKVRVRVGVRRVRSGVYQCLLPILPFLSAVSDSQPVGKKR